MTIEWTKNLSTGVKWQDDQHKELFARINRLLDAMSLGLGKDEVLKVFKFLDEYFVVHFEAEEQAMHKYGYPETLSHLEEHTKFIDDISRLEKEAKVGVTSSHVIQTQRRVVDWLVNHIGSIDKELGAFLKEAEKRERK
ncbi:MAG TPA: bacteriohemerythrin [Thermodesulfobacteriota bacterium]|nr:bacteriohemerythrin [Thermodesulfobacteriota bacterium]